MKSWFGWCCSQTLSADTEKIKKPSPAAVPKPEHPAQKAQQQAQQKPSTQAKDGRASGLPAVAQPACNTATAKQSAVADASAPSKDAGSNKAQSRPAPPPSSSKAEEEIVGMETETMSVVSATSNKSIGSMVSASSLASDMINSRIPAKAREASRIQQQIKKFVRSMVRGQPMGVVSPDGQMRTCTFSLDKRLKNFVIEVRGQERKIPLSSVLEVYQGKEPEDIETPLDELCSTVTLCEGGAITFHFDDIASRENFAICLQLLVDGQQ